MKLAPADGYTLMTTISGTMFTNRVLYKTLSYDADKDFVLISCLPNPPLPFVAHKSTGATRPGRVCCLRPRPGRDRRLLWARFRSHIISTQLNKHFGLNMRVVHYRGELLMWHDLLAGTVHAACGSYAGGGAAVLESGRAGRLQFQP